MEVLWKVKLDVVELNPQALLTAVADQVRDTCLVGLAFVTSSQTTFSNSGATSSSKYALGTEFGTMGSAGTNT